MNTFTYPGYIPKVTVFIRKDSRVKYWINYRLPNSDRMRLPVSSNKKQAEQYSIIKQGQLLNGIFTEEELVKLGRKNNKRLTIEKGLEQYFLLSSGKRNSNSKACDDCIIKALFREIGGLGKTHFDEIQVSDIQQVIQQRINSGRINLISANNYISKVRKVYNELIRAEVIHCENKADKVEKFRIAESQKSRKVFIPLEHLKRILAVQPSSQTQIDLRPIIHFILNTGARPGEVFHLEWPDIDLVNRIIRIRHKPNCPTKNGLGWMPKWKVERIIPINQFLWSLLKSLPQHETYGLIKGDDTLYHAKFVFPKRVVRIDRTECSTGKKCIKCRFIENCKARKISFLRCDSVKKEWKRMLKEAGLGGEDVLLDRFARKGTYQFYDLRKTWNTFGIETAGLSPIDASVIAGHDVEVNIRHYAGYISESVRDKMEKLPFDNLQ